MYALAASSLMDENSLNGDTDAGFPESGGEFDFRECIELNPYNHDVADGVIIVGKIINSKILNRRTIKDMIRKSWNLKPRAFIGGEGRNIFIINPFSAKRRLRLLIIPLGTLWTVYLTS